MHVLFLISSAKSLAGRFMVADKQWNTEPSADDRPKVPPHYLWGQAPEIRGASPFRIPTTTIFLKNKSNKIHVFIKRGGGQTKIKQDCIQKTASLLILLLFHSASVPNQLGQMEMHKSPLLFSPLKLNNSVTVLVQTNVVWLQNTISLFLVDCFERDVEVGVYH